MKNDQFERDIEIVPKDFNKLVIVNIDGENILKGELDIIDNVGKFWGTYSVEIKGSRDYPQQFPKLFETNNAFPKIMDWHVYEQDGSCCIDVPPNELIICSNGLH